MGIHERLLSIHFVLAGFTSAFAFNEYVNLANLSFLLLSLCLLFKRKIKLTPLTIPLIILGFVFFVIICISSFLSKEVGLGHVISRIYSVLNIIIYSIILSNIDINLKIIRSIIIGIVFGFFVSIIDLLSLFNFINYQIPRVNLQDLNVPFVFSFRLRGATEEPGYFGAYVASVLPILIWYYKGINRLIILLITFTILTTFSAAFLLWIITYLGLNIITYLKKKNILSIISSGIFLALILWFTALQIRDKINGRSLNDRLNSYESISIESSVGSFLFGQGPGAYKYYEVSQPTNLFLSTYFELGALGLSCMLIVILLGFITIKRKNRFLKSGLFAYTLFWISNGVYYHGYSILPIVYGSLNKKPQYEN